MATALQTAMQRKQADRQERNRQASRSATASATRKAAKMSYNPSFIPQYDTQTGQTVFKPRDIQTRSSRYVDIHSTTAQEQSKERAVAAKQQAQAQAKQDQAYGRAGPLAQLFGRDFAQTGKDASWTLDRLRQSATGQSPAQNQARAYHNQLVAQAQARGASPAELAAIERQGAAQAANLDWQSQMQGLQEYRSALGAMMRGQLTGFFGQQQLDTVAKPPVLPEQEPDILTKGINTIGNWFRRPLEIFGIET